MRSLAALAGLWLLKEWLAVRLARAQARALLARIAAERREREWRSAVQRP